MRRLTALVAIPTLLASASLPAAARVVTPLLPARGQIANPVSIDAHKTRIFLPLHNVTVRRHEAKVGSYLLELSSTTPGTLAIERAVHTGALHHLRIQLFETKAYIRADWRYAAPVDLNVRPDGVELVVYHRHAEPHFRTVAGGVRYWEGQRWNSAGPVRVRALRLDPRRVEIAPVLASPGSHMGLSTVGSLARSRHAIAAVNGGFFSPRTAEPQGALVINHTLVSRCMLDRPSFCLRRDGSAEIKVEKPAAWVRLDDGTGIKIQAVNERARHDRVTLFTAHYGHSTRTVTDPSRWELAISSAGTVVGEGHGNLAIPRGGYVLSGQGSGSSRLRKAIGFGQDVKVRFALNNQIVHAIGGGPTLLSDARVQVLARQQHFHGDVTGGRQPRTAIGVTGDGKYLLVCIDGRQHGYSVGETLKELAYTMKELGAVEAMNLDGGGSTAMWLRGRTINRPSDGHERAISTALLVLPRDGHVASALDGWLAAASRP